MQKEKVTGKLQLHSDQGSVNTPHAYFKANIIMQTKKLTPPAKRNQFVAESLILVHQAGILCSLLKLEAVQ